MSVGAVGGWLQGGGHGALSNTMGLGADRVVRRIHLELFRRKTTHCLFRQARIPSCNTRRPTQNYKRVPEL